jgi:hypothetical protein
MDVQFLSSVARETPESIIENWIIRQHGGVLSSRRRTKKEKKKKSRQQISRSLWSRTRLVPPWHVCRGGYQSPGLRGLRDYIGW